MIKRPNAYTHMAKWGMLSGTVLAVLLMTFVSTLGDAGGLIALIFPPVWLFAFIFGGIPGTILGAIEASFIKRYLQDAPVDFTKADIKAYRGQVYSAAGFLPIAVHAGLALFMGAISGLFATGAGYFLIFGIPAVIASIASIYAAHRYMFRLRLHGMRLRQSKLNHKDAQAYDTHRLVDGTAYETPRYEEDSRDGSYLIQG